ncbi:fibrocystin-L-like [Amphiura filiformis]|uniref:fibrocystin-L-like n=1 Tax=Amphiura filiformis TaxID=82378 RepID=UPI003B212EDC
MVMTQGWIKDNVQEGTPIKVARIYMKNATLAGDDLFIDNLFIGSDYDNYIRTSLPATPNGNFVYDVEVSKIDLGFDINFMAANCGHDFPLLGIKDATVLSGSAEPYSDIVVYGHPDFTAGTNMAVGRIVAATKPVTGSFELELNGKLVTVAADATAKKMKELVETNLDTGIVLVNQYGTCAGYAWDVEWASKGGNQPLIKVWCVV